jgi:signal peptidase
MKLPAVLQRDYVKTGVMIAVVILAVLLFWYGLSFVYRTENPILAVASESMEPVLYKGDLIVIEGIDSAADIHVGTKDSDRPGDIIVFHKPGGPEELIVHRAIQMIDNGDGTYSFKTRGDNNMVTDWWEVQESAIVGRYLDFKVPWLGNIALFFVPFEVKIAFITLWIIILLLVEFSPSIMKKIKRNDDDASLYK